jgi:redox-sensitive bicupin YhaK (pirin superfamily)
LETICSQGEDDEGVHDDDNPSSITPIPSPLPARGNDDTSPSTNANEVNEKNASSSTLDSNDLRQQEQQKDTKSDLLSVDNNSSNAEKSSKGSKTSRILLNHFTIIYVVSGSISVAVNGAETDEDAIVKAGQTLVVDRHEDAAPTELEMAPVLSKLKTNGEQKAQLRGRSSIF